MSPPICGRQSTTRPFRFGFGCYFITLKYCGPRHFSKLKRFPYKKVDGGKKPTQTGPRSGAARRRHKSPSIPHVPSAHSRQAPPFGGQVGLPRATSPSNSRKTLQPTHGQTHRISLPHLTVNPSPPFPPTSHSQIDGRRQAAHSPREESVMAGSMQVPSMAMCGIDGFERPLHPSQSERALASDLNIQIRSKCTCSLGASKAVVQNRINCTHLGRHFPVRGVRGTSRRVQPPRKPGKPFQCDAPGAASSSVRSLRNRKTIPE